MRLDQAIIATNQAPYHVEAACLSAAGWRRLGVDCVVGFVGEAIPSLLAKHGLRVVRVPPPEGVPTAFAAQVVRLLLPCLFPEAVSVLSDADMVPLSRSYFLSPLEEVPVDRLVVYRPFDRIPEGRRTDLHERQIPICYNAAGGDVWREVFAVRTPEQLQSTLLDWYEERREQPDLWSSDQVLLWAAVHRWDPGGARTVFLGDARLPHRRLHLRDLMRHSRRKRGYVRFRTWLRTGTDLHLEPPLSRWQPELDAFLCGMGIVERGRADPEPAGDGLRPRLERITDLETSNAWGTHLAPLATAVVNTEGPILELGAGDTSTPLLHALCAPARRNLVTVDTNRAWLERYADLQTDWHRLVHGLENAMAGATRWGVVLVDHQPGKRRAADILHLRSRAQVFVVHDVEEPDYDYKPALAQFRYTYTYNRYATWTAVASDVVDVRAWFRGQLADAPGLLISGRPCLPARFGWIMPRPREVIRAALHAARWGIRGSALP